MIPFDRSPCLCRSTQAFRPNCFSHTKNLAFRLPFSFFVALFSPSPSFRLDASVATASCVGVGAGCGADVVAVCGAVGAVGASCRLSRVWRGRDDAVGVCFRVWVLFCVFFVAVVYVPVRVCVFVGVCG